MQMYELNCYLQHKSVDDASFNSQRSVMYVLSQTERFNSYSEDMASEFFIENKNSTKPEWEWYYFLSRIYSQTSFYSITKMREKPVKSIT